MEYVLGIDIGGTNLVVAAVATDGSRIEGLRSEPTEAGRGADDVISRLVAMARRTIDDTRAADPSSRLTGIGIGSPGPVDVGAGVVLLTPSLGWVDMPVRDLIANPLGLPATLDNDATCAMAGEWWLGAARGARHAVTFTLGTGIGGGLVVDGKVVHGASDVAGEIGHITIEPNGRRCGCGNDGCLEAYASGTAIARRMTEAIGAGGESLLAGPGDRGPLTAQAVYEAAASGDALALEVVHDTAKYLGVGVANLINILNPEIVVICGGVTQAGERLFTPLRREVTRRAFKPAVEVCRIVPGELPGTAGVVGAAKIFLETHA